MTNTNDTPNRDSAKTLTTVVYALHALGLLGFGLPFIVAIVINYVKIDDVQGTWLESHFRWQIRTFWYGLLWGVIGSILLLVLVGWFILAADAIWVIYRIVKGWLKLNEGKEVFPQ